MTDSNFPTNLMDAVHKGRIPRGVAPRHGFLIVTESKPPMSEAAVCALLNAGLELAGTPVRIVDARPTDE